MDGLSILFGILTVLFLAVVLGINILGTTAAPKIELDQEGFASGDSPRLGPNLGPNSGFSSQSEGFEDATPTLETKIKKVLDPLAFYTSPDGKPISAGKDLCDVFTQVRQALAQSVSAGADTLPSAGLPQNIKGTDTISDAELMKKVEAQLAMDIPGGALSCPLLQYPASTATDLEWLTWVQSLPKDFGARVVFMASYADDKLSSVAKSMKDALSASVNVPKIPKIEGFFDSAICTPMLAEKKRLDQESASCVDPKTLSPQQIEAEVMNLLQVLVSEKERILKALPLKDRTVIIKDPIKSIQSAKVAAEYLNTQKQKAQEGTLTLS